jgi:hypothetical protein
MLLCPSLRRFRTKFLAFLLVGAIGIEALASRGAVK